MFGELNVCGFEQSLTAFDPIKTRLTLDVYSNIYFNTSQAIMRADINTYNCPQTGT